MKLPKTFDYGHLKYDIVETQADPPMRSEDGRELSGWHSQGKGKLFIHADGSPDEYVRFVLMHEILHAITSAQGIVFPDNEEAIIDGLAFGIIQALHQNPWMHDFFSE